jgi:HlyD family secretion protein
MKTSRKILIGVGGVVLLMGIGSYISYQLKKGVVSVQTGQVVRQDVTSVVTASGEIRPKNYTNVVGQGIGLITEIVVKEGDHVKKGDVLLHVESVQPGADVQAQVAGIDAADSGMKAAAANYDSAVATLAQRQSDLNKAKLDWDRYQSLYKEQLIAKQDYDATKAVYDSAAAGLKASEAQVAELRASRDQASSMLDQNRAQLKHLQDVLRKTTYTAPIDGIVSYVAVRVGENVVPGIQNAQGSFLLTISDMSVVTSEVKVDETDITELKVGQPADVSIDAVPGQLFHGRVTQVGDLAILRTSGEAAMTETTANTQEARDFKVVVTLDNPPDGLRPGLSTTARIQTAQKKNVLTVPVQALAERTPKELQEALQKNGGGSVTLAAAKTDDSAPAPKNVEGVFVVRGGLGQFVPVQTGISGVTDIEVISGLQEGDQIITGSYQALRTLKPGAKIKIDNTVTARDETSGS